MCYRCLFVMTKLLILSSDTGEGHNSAARAIQSAAESAGLLVSLRKPLEESSSANRSLAHLYNFFLTHRPGWVGGFLRTIDYLKPNEANIFYSRARSYIQRFIESERPDVLLSVHPRLTHLIQRWVAERGMDIRCITFVTDPFPPFWKGWSSPYIQTYFVLTEDAGGALVANGIPSGRIEQVAMPIRDGFRPRSPEEVAALRTELGIEGATILVNGGARGGGPLLHLVRTVREAAPDANILVVCGHNRRALEKIETIRDARIRTFGFVREIHNLVGAADLAITKPGALATYETLASGVPVALTAVGGLMPQESGLFEAATTRGFGYAVRTMEELREVLRQGLGGWREKRDAIQRFYRPGSNLEIIERIQPSHVRT